VTRRRRRASVKPDGNALVYGKAVQFSVDAGGKRSAYTVDTPRGDVPFEGLAEWPGEWCYPPQGAFIVSAARLALGLLRGGVCGVGVGLGGVADSQPLAASRNPRGGIFMQRRSYLR
jgi:hypothetical protein